MEKILVIDMYKMNKQELIMLECLVRCLAKHGEDWKIYWRPFKEHNNYSMNKLFKSINSKWYKFNDKLMDIIKNEVDSKYHYYVIIED